MTEIVMSLEKHEAEIQSAVDFVDCNLVKIANHLKAIHDGKLYKDKYKTFAAYMKSRWDRSRSEGYRLINAGSVFEDLSRAGTNLPESARQTEQIAIASEIPSVRAEVWSESKKVSGNDQPSPDIIKSTAVAVIAKQRTVQDILAEQRAKNLPTPETIAVDVIVAALEKLGPKIDRLLSDLDSAIDAKAKSTTKMATMTVSLKKKVGSIRQDVGQFSESVSVMAKSWSGNRKQVDDLA